MNYDEFKTQIDETGTPPPMQPQPEYQERGPVSEPGFVKATNWVFNCLKVAIPVFVVGAIAVSYSQNTDDYNRSIDRATNPAWWLVWMCGGSEEELNAYVRRTRQSSNAGWGNED